MLASWSTDDISELLRDAVEDRSLSRRHAREPLDGPACLGLLRRQPHHLVRARGVGASTGCRPLQLVVKRVELGGLQAGDSFAQLGRKSVAESCFGRWGVYVRH